MEEFLRVGYLQLILLFIILALIFAFVGLYQEVKLKQRVKINYDNYEVLKKYYHLKINIFYLILFIFYVITSSVVAMVIVRDDVYGKYSLVLPLLNILLFPLIYLHLTRIKLNRDLSNYSLYYQLINRNYYNKLLLTQQLQVLLNTYKNLHNDCTKINKIFENYFSVFNGIDNLETTLLPLNDIITTHQDELANFDHSYPNKFNQSLNLYLSTGVHSKLEIKEFIYKSNYSLKKLVDSIKKAQILSIYNFTLKNIIDKNIDSTTNLIKIINALISLNVSLDDKFVIEVLNYIENQVDDRKLLLSELIINKLITVEVLCEYVNVKDLDWVYEVSNYIDTKDYLKIFTSMIKNDAYNSAKRVLSSLDNKLSFNITKALTKVKKDNNTYKLFVLYKKIYTSGNFFNVKAVKYENLAIVLDIFFKEYFPRDIDAPVINEIIQKRTFDINRANIEVIYERIQEGYNKLFVSTMNTLLIYSKSKCTTLSYIDYEKVITQYAHYRKNLNLNELKVLNELLIGLILINEDDESIINELYTVLSQSYISYSLSSLSLTYYNRTNIGKQIINNLTKNRLEILKTIVYRIENDRLVLDRIINL